MKTPEDAKLFDYMVDALSLTFAADHALSVGDTASYNHFRESEKAAHEALGFKED